MMRWSIFVDLGRLLADDELGAVSEALEQHVPDGGSTTPRPQGHELFFVIDASSESDAHAIATRYTNEILAEAGIQLDFDVTASPARDSAPTL
jgi:hypothetical protein